MPYGYIEGFKVSLRYFYIYPVHTSNVSNITKVTRFSGVHCVHSTTFILTMCVRHLDFNCFSIIIKLIAH